ncbi:Phytanoyl-CoA hydroxylase-interacting protein-like C-terminal domain-containing protein [Caenorhabditis elegans]|uniref:Phytanoyl-CoA hydroxylase-interacting protein-like C-terminal domain-containing protein n=1 Tax=Caenorhabditis elegans TaxID=6239 RepID=O17963_CAEEL|nr:Phytanoyl-CoA hydroxylase-interacting protein-like C-terminal domain-containing protein [Caenorhabditis elegans]CAB05567.2 Phytanoyl-CoA hydroxylase-interacting protein-like C-terminal domain-containing protein [Caenorhabditis elegans]|eukprot:NP_506779.2 Uncharacterized protein CELE_M01B2.10 [Caenorhabditis elegans]
MQNVIALIPVKCTVSSEKIELRWKKSKKREDMRFLVKFENLVSQQTTRMELSSTLTIYEVQTLIFPGEKYLVELRGVSLENNTLVAMWSQEIRAEFCPKELADLLEKCHVFIGKETAQLQEIKNLYRCKPKPYWDYIYNFRGKVMEKYIKDDNGQPGNLINRKLHGLFFSARLTSGSLPSSSPFGNIRMDVDCNLILNPFKHSFYFADFYCNKAYHYATIVICEIGSTSYKYCNEKLIKLDPFSNPFIKLVPTAIPGQWLYFNNRTVWVELFYTENVHLDFGRFTSIIATGAGTSRINGLDNNKCCEICNLYPLET